ncbi:ABC1K3, partial [Symbiodinium necroappetens]
RDDYIPPQYLAWAKKLQDEAPVSLSSTEARQFIAAELGLSEPQGLDAVFEDWSPLPIGSASIGQVYLAKLRSSRERVAVKVQMPGAEHLFRVDIKTLKLFTSFAFPWAVDHMNELEAMFESEFDYALERDALKQILTDHDWDELLTG